MPGSHIHVPTVLSQWSSYISLTSVPMEQVHGQVTGRTVGTSVPRSLTLTILEPSHVSTRAE